MYAFLRKEVTNAMVTSAAPNISVALLTGGGDRPYVFGLTTALTPQGTMLDLIGSDELDLAEFHGNPRVNFLNLRGSHRPDASVVSKSFRVAAYYIKLIRYAATAKPRIFHILWNNKFEFFDRTLLMLYYRGLGKRIAFTVHNVNAGRRDGTDTSLNRLTLRIQYRLADCIFVHTEKMKGELIDEFGVQGDRVTIIPFGINNSLPNTSLTTLEARQRLGIGQGEKTILFFGNITPYKGLEYLVAAFKRLQAGREDYRLIIAGRPDKCEKYWGAIREDIREEVERGQILLKDMFIPDDEAEVYFKAADALVLPYTHVYQSGVLFTGQNFGLPVLAADVGSLKDDIVEGKTGFVFRPQDPEHLASTVEQFFASDLYANLNNRRQEIRDYATERHSWDVVGQMTINVYAKLLRSHASGKSLIGDVSSASLDVEPLHKEASANSGSAR